MTRAGQLGQRADDLPPASAPGAAWEGHRLQQVVIEVAERLDIHRVASLLDDDSPWSEPASDGRRAHFRLRVVRRSAARGPGGLTGVVGKVDAAVLNFERDGAMSYGHVQVALANGLRGDPPL